MIKDELETPSAYDVFVVSVIVLTAVLIDELLAEAIAEPIDVSRKSCSEGASQSRSVEAARLGRPGSSLSCNTLRVNFLNAASLSAKLFPGEFQTRHPTPGSMRARGT